MSLVMRTGRRNLLADSEHDLGAMDGGADGAHRFVDDQLNADGRGKMENTVAPGPWQASTAGSLSTESWTNWKPALLRSRMGDVAFAAGGEIVEHDDGVSHFVGQQPLGPDASR